MPSKAAQRAYYERNRDTVIAKAAARRLADPEASRAYQQDWYERNQEEVRERSRKWTRDHPEEAKASARDWQQKNPERRKQHLAKSELKRKHGLTLDERAAMLVAQGGNCYLCGRELSLSAAVVDHDHSCCTKSSCPRCRRGLAHRNCNSAIGLFLDDPAVLRRVADNLEAAQLLVAGMIGG